LGGYESMLKKMTAGNFNWLIHSMLFYHTQHVIAKQKQKAKKKKKSDDDGSGSDSGSIGSDSDSDSNDM
jgi:hypothetical protein